MENTNQTKSGFNLLIAVFLVIIGGLSILNLFIEAPFILVSERRVPERIPTLSASTVTSGDFMYGFEPFAADNFPFREQFRTLRAATVFGAFLQTDKDGIYMDSHGIGSFSHINADSVSLLADKILVVSESLGEMNVFYAFIPDKSIFSNRAMPGFDYVLTESLLRSRLSPHEFTFIPLVDAMSADSFYRTDLHWNQTEIHDVVDALSAAMGVYVDFSRFTVEFAGDFRGGYAGQLALPTAAEPLYFLTNPTVSAFYLNMGNGELEVGPVYDLNLFRGLDPYDIFLRGAQPIVVLENVNANSDRHLYLFRDSFGSSLAPILADAYAKITLIDFRFIDLRTLHKIIEFRPGSDVLFLYSSGILNQSDMLLVPARSFYD